MKTVWKFPIQIIDTQSVKAPAGSRILHVGLDPSGAPCIWAKVDPLEPAVEYSVFVTGTGHPVPDGDTRYIGSFNDGPFVWHVWVPME